ncbi:MAG TPA: glycosyltransferase family 4 protein [Gaiellaceae bacterium]
MRVALVYRHFNERGSIERQHVGLARYLVEAGHDVHVFSILETSEPDLVPGAGFHPVPVAGLGRGGWSARELFSFARNSRSMAAAGDFDCVYGRAPGCVDADILYLGGVAPGGTRRRGHSPLRHAVSVGRRPGELARRVVERRGVRSGGVHRFHVDSTQVADDLVRHHRIDRNRIVITPPPIDLERFRPSESPQRIRDELGIAADEAVVLFCGHDFRRKGLDRAIDALAAMERPATLLVVGKRDPEPFRRQASALGISDRVRFFGERADTERFHQIADVCVLPSRLEMWGAPVVEAMATGVPPIVSGVAGVADVVLDGETGFVLSEPFDVAELTRRLDELVGSETLRDDLGARAREAVSTYSWEVLGARLEAEIAAVAEERRSARPEPSAR